MFELTLSLSRLVSPPVYNTIGYGWGCSILALVAAVVGGPAAPLLYIYGERIRTHSRYAHRSDANKTDAA